MTEPTIYFTFPWGICCCYNLFPLHLHSCLKKVFACSSKKFGYQQTLIDAPAESDKLFQHGNHDSFLSEDCTCVIFNIWQGIYQPSTITKATNICKLTDYQFSFFAITDKTSNFLYFWFPITKHMKKDQKISSWSVGSQLRTHVPLLVLLAQ